MGGKLRLQNEDRCKFTTEELTTPVTAKSVSIFNLNSKANFKQKIVFYS